MIRIPLPFHEAFGEKQSLLEIVLVLLFGIGGTAAMAVLQPDALSGLSTWRVVLALVLVFDVLAGCLANFTRGTNDYYSARPVARWIFIAVHVHLPLIALLLGTPLTPALIVWGYTIAGALLVNALRQNARQVFVAATLLGTGLLMVQFLRLDTFMTVVAALFLVKVQYGFAVDHSRTHR
ncbi:MAG: hypothetical protein JXB36_00030 [Gammaproteobacteria bacterium]|nr:hypothetical protein [Gammaproteobacteria bacterium]